eukprot:jgi/Undpi1/7243/HiC_scaffold_22.g09716.m1
MEVRSRQDAKSVCIKRRHEDMSAGEVLEEDCFVCYVKAVALIGLRGRGRGGKRKRGGRSLVEAALSKIGAGMALLVREKELNAVLERLQSYLQYGRGRSDLGEDARAFKARTLEWETPPGVCEYTWGSDTCPRRLCSMVRFRASKSDQKREGCTITRTRAAGVALDAGRLAGAFEALQELRNVHPQLPGEAPLTVRRTPSGWNVLTRTEAVATLRLMVGSSGRDPAQYALHSGRIGGATQLAGQGIPELQIQRAGRWKSRAFMTYVRAAGEGADSVSAALAK